MKPQENIQYAFDFGEPNNLHQSTSSQLPEKKISFNDKHREKLTALLEKHEQFTDSAVIAHNKLEKNEKRRAKIRIVGNTLFTVLAGSAVSQLPSLAADMEQYKNVVSAFEMKSLLSGAMGGISEHIEKLMDVVQENYAGLIRFGGWQALLVQGKGVWNNFFDKTLGAYSSGGEKMDAASVVAAYEKIGIKIFDGDDGTVYNIDSIKNKIQTFKEQGNTKDTVQIAHFLRGAGFLSHDHYQDILRDKLAENLNSSKNREISPDIAMAIAPSASIIADVLYKSFHFETDRRKSVPIVNKVIKTELFTENEYKELKSFMKTCHAFDVGGLHKTSSNEDSFESRDLIADHILNALISDNGLAAGEIQEMINMTEKAITKLNLEVEPDAVPKAYMPSTKQGLVNSLGSEAIQAITDVKEKISNNELSTQNKAIPSGRKP